VSLYQELLDDQARRASWGYLRAIARLLGGKINVESETGTYRDCEFWIESDSEEPDTAGTLRAVWAVHQPTNAIVAHSVRSITHAVHFVRKFASDPEYRKSLISGN
jgi:hypothetical protein